MRNWAEQEAHRFPQKETLTAAISFETAIQNLFFPGQDVRISTIKTQSNNVRLVQTPEREYVAKSMHATPYNLEVMDVERLWSDRINGMKIIAAPTYIQSHNHTFFPMFTTDTDYYLSIMTRVEHVPFELHSYRDFERMGKALALLHQAAPHEGRAVIRRFEFEKTNPFVENFWKHLSSEEASIFNEILHIPIHCEILPSALTHNDVHPENLMSHNGTPFFIDFNQMLVGPRINDVGQALSAFWIEETQEGFEKAMNALIRGYGQIALLTPEEIKVLPYFALRKACISFTWFKGLARNGEPGAESWYQRILRRALIIDRFIKNKNGHNQYHVS